jgi:hypothetical protein
MDADYGQWGLRILSPDQSVERTRRELSERKDAFRSGDVVLGEFFGDQDLLVVDKEGRVLVALPLDPRADWFQPAPTLTEFFDRYVSTDGAKYWEQKRG